MSHQPMLTGLGTPLVPNEYQTGLCGCFSDGKVCLDGWCCEWCQAGYQHTKVNLGRGGEMDKAVCCGLCCVDWFCCYGQAISCWTGLKSRPETNRIFGIEEGFAISCLKGYCCPWCSVCQQQREFKYRNYAAGGICDTTVHPPGKPLGAPAPGFPGMPPQHGSVQ